MRRRRNANGFAYIGLLVAIVLLGAALASIGAVWTVQAQRERELELLWRGDAIRQAIRLYVISGAHYPMELQDLVSDERAAKPKRYLRRIYEDPMTGAADWTLIRAGDGGIMGVASASQAAPLKRKGFSDLDAAFEDSDCYCTWQFVYQPRLWRPVVPNPAAVPRLNPGNNPGNTPGTYPSTTPSGWPTQRQPNYTPPSMLPGRHP